jgi:hypothetical protein
MEDVEPTLQESEFLRHGHPPDSADLSLCDFFLFDYFHEKMKFLSNERLCRNTVWIGGRSRFTRITSVRWRAGRRSGGGRILQKGFLDDHQKGDHQEHRLCREIGSGRWKLKRTKMGA